MPARLFGGLTGNFIDAFRLGAKERLVLPGSYSTNGIDPIGKAPGSLLHDDPPGFR